MDRSDVKELYFISLISNIQSIIEHGILSHNQSVQLPHDDSIAMQEMQEKRKIKKFLEQTRNCTILPISISMLIIQC